MYCRNCGTKLNEEDKFCSECGMVMAQCEVEKVECDVETSKKTLENAEEQLKVALHEGKNIFFMLFSKEPLKLLSYNPNRISVIRYIIICAYILAFAFVLCNNIAQIVNYLLEEIIADANAKMSTYFTLPNIQLPISYDGFGIFTMGAFLLLALEAMGIYLIVVKGKKDTLIYSVINMLAITILPMVVGTTLNYILGFIYPPATVGVLAASACVHIIFLYKGIKHMGNLNDELFWKFSLMILSIGILASIIITISVEHLLNEVFSEVEQYINTFGNEVFDMFNYFG